MYEYILLTLDGSPLAEQAVPHALAMARAFHARLHLLTVVAVPRHEGRGEAVEAAHLERDAQEAGDYLANLRAQLAEEGLECQTAVRRGDIAEEIILHAAGIGANLIVMCTHGRSGLGRWVYGSVADRVLRHAAVPVLLVRATE
jgi:nucleotide-binding universal stress UspA family protein